MVGDILQPTHLLFILIVALVVLGPKRLPEVARTLGEGLRDFKSAISGERDESPLHDPPDHHIDYPAVEQAAEPDPVESPAPNGAEPAHPAPTPEPGEPPRTAVPVEAVPPAETVQMPRAADPTEAPREADTLQAPRAPDPERLG
jgi:sec-independent protein translocase protein TatA